MSLTKTIEEGITPFRKKNTMAKHNQPRLADIARHVGVSISTASAVLNDRHKIRISDKTKRLVKAAANNLNYVALRERLSQTGLAVRVFSPSHARGLMTQGILRGAEEALSKINGKVIFGAADQAIVRLRENPKEFMEGIAGVIFQSRIDDETLYLFCERRIPTVVVGTGEIRGDIDMVYPSYTDYVQKALPLLWNLGHRRVGLLTGPLPHHSYRMAAMLFRECGRELGLETPAKYIEVMASSDDYYAALKRLLDRPRRPTAIVGQLGNSRAWIEAWGIRIPEDLSIISFDFGADSSGKPLSYIGTDSVLLGREAMHLLMLRKEHPDLPCRHIVLPLSLYDHGSCAAPPADQLPAAAALSRAGKHKRITL